MTTDRDFDNTAYVRGYKNGRRDAAAEIASLKAEVARLRAAQEWRFLKDAPIDDTLVLWLLRNGEVVIGPSKLGDLTVRERAEIYQKTGEWPSMSEYQPARWMPIPAPPALTTQETQG